MPEYKMVILPHPVNAPTPCFIEFKRVETVCRMIRIIAAIMRIKLVACNTVS
jgi:hypothetical protein